MLFIASSSIGKSQQLGHAFASMDNIVTIGDVIDVPMMELTHGTETKKVEGLIVYPDGSSRAGKRFTISMPGVYQVIYRALFGLEQEEKVFTYTCHRTSGSFFESSNRLYSASYGEYSFSNKSSPIKGAKLTLAPGTTYYFDQIIDFSSFDSDTSFIEYIVDTSVQGESDLETLTIRLTDVDDSSNYVDITTTDSGPIDDWGEGCYILAGANNQFKTGYERNTLHVGHYGSNIGCSFRALPEGTPTNPVKLYFDYAKRALYAYPVFRSNDKTMITDLDDKKIYRSTLWEGFSSGKAQMSIFSNSLKSPTASIIVTKAGSLDFSQDIFEDHIAPIITIDYEGQSPLDVPKASVGRQYNLFKADITDNYDKNLTYKTSVTYRDTENGQYKDVSVINNTFTPQKAGTYTVKYTARDHSNNVATKNINVVAVGDTQAMTATLDTNVVNELIFTKIQLPTVDEVHVSGGSGKPFIERKLYDANHNEIEIIDDLFTPQKAGVYTVNYIATDYIGNVAIAKLTINALEPDNPIFVGDLYLPRVLVKGHKYRLPVYQAVETINGETVYLNPSVSVNNTLLDNGEFIAGEECHIKYSVSGTKGSNEYNTSIDVIDGNDATVQTEYFYGNFDSVVENERNVNLTTNHDASTLFAGLLPYDSAIAEFELLDGLTNFQSIKFKFTQADNPDVSLTFKVRLEGDSAFISIGSSPNELPFSFVKTTNGKAFNINFNNNTKVLLDIKDETIDIIKNNDIGKPFLGFTGGLYLDISVQGVTSESSINISGISNQGLGHRNRHEDNYSPIIILRNRFVNEQKYGEMAYIPKADAFDVLGNVSSSLTVEAPDGSYKIRSAPIDGDNTFLLDQIGAYTIFYNAEDDSGNTSEVSRKITVYDTVAPTLTVNNNLKQSYKINSKVTIPTYSVSDNRNLYTVNVLLLLPNNEERLLLVDKNGQVTSYLDNSTSLYNSSFKVDSRTFRVEQYGQYTLRFVAYDDAFNKVSQDITFIVK